MHDRQYFIPEEEGLDSQALSALQRRKLSAMLREVMAGNAFYRNKYAGVAFDPERDPLDTLPFTTRAELEQDQIAHPLYGTNLTYPLDRYCRFHHTSGTSGQPLRWIDTAESWDWLKKCWGIIYRAAGVTTRDRVMFPFSFGPFLGFWAAFDAAVALGNLSLPAGGMTTPNRLKMLIDNQVTVVCCTPTYALRMAEVAQDEGFDLAGSAVRALIVAGEPGGHIPATRRKIERAWGARVFDHTGMTEVGSLGFECTENPADVHLIESECIPEVIDPQTGRVLPDGEAGELVITNLGRIGRPVIRYRTGDQVTLTRERCTCGRSFARMKGGILGRADDMFIIRGNNVFPSALEGIIRQFPEVVEYRAQVYQTGGLSQLRIDIEPVAGVNGAAPDLVERISAALHRIFAFRAEIRAVDPGSLPRFEMKARRFTRASAIQDSGVRAASAAGTQDSRPL
jgi:phenylacetate-CoA ligase